MALKDWKIFGKNSASISWIKIKDNYGSNPHINGISIGIRAIVGDFKSGSWKSSKHWVFEETNKGFISDRHSFKNKSLALKFAKEFMRTH